MGLSLAPYENLKWQYLAPTWALSRGAFKLDPICHIILARGLGPIRSTLKGQRVRKVWDIQVFR